MNTELIQYYQNLLLIQYRKPKANATITALVGLLMIYDLMIMVRDGYNIDTAVGHQQDIIGKYLGITRVVKGFPLETTYWGYVTYGSTLPVAGVEPYSEYADTPPSPGFLSYEDGLETYTMTDDEFRIILGMALRRRNTDSSIKTIHAVLFPVFGTSYAVFEGPMVINYKVNTTFKRLAAIADGAGMFPKPMAVKTTIVVEDVLSS